MWQAFRGHSRINIQVTESMGDLLQSTSRHLILASGTIYLVWQVAVAGSSPLEYLPRFFTVAPLVVLTCLLALALLPTRLLAAQVIWQLGAAAAITESIYVYRQPEIAFAYILLPMTAGLVFGLAGGALAEGVAAALMAILVNNAALPAGSALFSSVLMAGAAAGVLGWTANRALLTASEWFISAWTEADRHLEEVRENRAELARVLSSLDLAYLRLERANVTLAAAWKAAIDAERFKTEFLAKVSHEFRTPLSTIIGLTDQIVEDPEAYGDELPPLLLEHLEIVHRNCDHLSHMIDDILNLAQVETKRLKLRMEKVDLSEVIGRACALIRAPIERKHLALRVTVPDDLPEIPCDRTRISQVIVNLLSNAAKFTQTGGITVKVTQQRHEILVSVSDTGPGIAPGDAQRIFEPFVQGRERAWQDKPGSGLGLAVSKQFVEMHGGRMWLESQQGSGSTFHFALPREQAVQPGALGQPPDLLADFPPEDEPPGGFYEPRIIVCDGTGQAYPLLARRAGRARLTEVRSLEEAAREWERRPVQAVLLCAESAEGLWAAAQRAARAMPDTPIAGCTLEPDRDGAAGQQETAGERVLGNLLLITVGAGLSVDSVLHCALQLPVTLLELEQAPRPAPG